MNIAKMIHDLYRLKREWKREADAADVVDGHNCARNILRGIDMAFKIVDAHAHAPRSWRDNSPKQKGFTLVELMIVIAIIGILAGIAIPQIGNMTRKAHEAGTKGNLATMRAALSIYYGDTEGTSPTDDLASLTLGSKYLNRIYPTYVEPWHRPGNVVATGDLAAFTASDADLTNWFYFNVPADSRFGMLIVNCIHSDARGTVWTSY
jgi:prepilin-type N-terminal cleavage/methylation domain-containing protein